MDTVSARVTINENWGFCLSHRQLEAMHDDEYEVCIDSSLTDGHLTYGEYLIQGQSQDEILISCHICHPSLCNDNLSGIVLRRNLAAQLASQGKPRYSYRFLFIPGTIGSITWLALNEAQAGEFAMAWWSLVSATADNSPTSRAAGRRRDRPCAIHVLKPLRVCVDEAGVFFHTVTMNGSIFAGFDLPVGCLMRSTHGSFPEYHTSADQSRFRPARVLGGNPASVSRCCGGTRA